MPIFRAKPSVAGSGTGYVKFNQAEKMSLAIVSTIIGSPASVLIINGVEEDHVLEDQ